MSRGKAMMELRHIAPSANKDDVTDIKPDKKEVSSEEGDTYSCEGIEVIGAYSQNMPLYCYKNGITSFLLLATDEEIQLHNEACLARDEEREEKKSELSEDEYNNYYRDHPLKDYYPEDKKDLCTDELPLGVGNRYFKSLAVGDPYTDSRDDLYKDEDGLNDKKREDFFATIKNMNKYGYKTTPCTIRGVYKMFNSSPKERGIAPVKFFDTVFIAHPMEVLGKDEEGVLQTKVDDSIKKLSADGIYILDPEEYLSDDNKHGYGFYLDVLVNELDFLNYNRTDSEKAKNWKEVCETEYL